MIENTSLKSKLLEIAGNASHVSTDKIGNKELITIKKAEALKVQNTVDEHRSKSQDKALKDELIRVSQALNKEMQESNIDVAFRYNDDIQGLVVTVKNAESEKVVREIPSKEAIELMKKMGEIVGMLFDKKC